MIQKIPGLRSLSKFLSRKAPITKHYSGQGSHFGSWIYNSKRPIFNRLMAQAMSADPHIQFGMRLIKGPITAGSRFYTECDNPDIKEYVNRQITNFWRSGLKYALRSMEYGWYGTEVMYKMEDMQLHFDSFQNIDPLSVKPWLVNNNLTGIEVILGQHSNTHAVYLGVPKCFWTVHARETNRWWGQSRFYGAHIPWYEYNAPDGYRDSRALYNYKCAFNSGVLYYPSGGVPDEHGNVVPNEHIAQRVMNEFRNGSDMILPRSANPDQNWEWVAPQSVDLSESFQKYGHDLKVEMLEALGVPSEVVEAAGTGAYAGRQIPQEAFYSLLQEIVQDIITDFDEQILEPLVSVNFGDRHASYTIECFGLLRNLEEDRGNHKEDARQAMGQDPEQGQQTQDPYLSERGEQVNMSALILPERPDPSSTYWAFQQRAA